MAKVISFKYHQKKRVKRPGVHSKNGSSKCKTSKNYKKPNIGQGR